MIALLAVPAAAAIAVGALSTMAVGETALLRQRALTAADLSALAAVTGGCAAAGTVAAAHGTELLHCAIEGTDAAVTVDAGQPATLRWLGAQVPSATASARAGLPASS